MCNFFSLRSDGAGNVFYLNAEQRAKLRAERPSESPDSHSFIAEFYGYKGKDEDMLNAYEWNPLTKQFTIDRMPNKDDSQLVKQWCENLDIKTVVPELNIKPIIHPLRDINKQNVTEREITLLKQWDSVRDSVWASVGDSVMASVRASVWASVGASVGASVWASVGDSVGSSVWDSVWASVGASVWASVRASVWDSVGASVWASVWDSVWAYTSGFFTLDKWLYIDHQSGINPYQPCIDLWESGFVPSFDGKTWRLHSGKNAEIVYEWKQ